MRTPALAAVCAEVGAMTEPARVLVIAACGPDITGAVTEAVMAPAGMVIAADSGVDVAHRLGRRVDVVVGDLDSAGEEALGWATRLGATLRRHDSRKDFTDLELAMDLAVASGGLVHVVASMGGRVDHAAANLAVLASPRWADAAVSATIDSAEVQVVRGRRTVHGEVGDTVSLLAVGGPAHVARTNGFDYPLVDEALTATEARGLSNVITSTPAWIEVSQGVVLAIRPHQPSTSPASPR